jgi:hypothetical protein
MYALGRWLAFPLPRIKTFAAVLKDNAAIGKREVSPQVLPLDVAYLT